MCINNWVPHIQSKVQFKHFFKHWCSNNNLPELKTQKEKKKKMKHWCSNTKERGRKIRYCCPWCSFLHIHLANLIAKEDNVDVVEALCDELFNCVLVALQGWKISGMKKIKNKTKRYMETISFSSKSLVHTRCFVSLFEQWCSS